MIPKIIHYCWFGDKPKPQIVIQCIDTWRRQLPDYRMMEWTEHNCPLFASDEYPYLHEAYEARMYAFVSDIVRLWALREYGGIYMDTDVEVVRSFDSYLDCRMFLGFELPNFVATCMIAAEAEHPLVAQMLDTYRTRHFVITHAEAKCISKDEKLIYPHPDNRDLVCNCYSNAKLLTRMLRQMGLVPNGQTQVLTDDVHIYPMDYFVAYDYTTGLLYPTEYTITIHHAMHSWNHESLLARLRHRLKLTLYSWLR